METLWRTALWRQFGAAIDVLEKALVACPTPLWTRRVWPAPADRPLPPWFPPEFAQFWYLGYHALFWLDLYLTGDREEDFTPPAPFIWTEADPPVSPERPYTQEELLAYLAALRRKCHATLVTLTDEQARRIIDYPWAQGQAVSYLELLFYNMRHVQEHAAQLSLFLGQHGVSDEALEAVARAQEEPGSP